MSGARPLHTSEQTSRASRTFAAARPHAAQDSRHAFPQATDIKRTQSGGWRRRLIAVLLMALSMLLIGLQHVPETLASLTIILAALLCARIGGRRPVYYSLAVMVLGLVVLVASQILSWPYALITALVAGAVALASRRHIGPHYGPHGLFAETEAVVLDKLMENVPVILLNENGLILRASNACNELFALPRDQMEGRPFSERVARFDFRIHAGTQAVTGLIPPPSGDWMAVRDHKPPVPVEIWLEHSPQGPLLRLTDLGPRQAADAQARELHSQLNKVWRLNSLGEMAATLAHELNQPLAAAASYLYAAQEDMKRAGLLGDSALRTSDLAKAQMLRAGQIIRRMRELLNMEMRTLAPEKVRRVIEDVLPILTLTGQEKQVAISVDVDSPDTVRMDRIQFQQALVNLVRNAVEASPENAKVLITGRIISDLVYEIAVEDSGPGIAPDQVERVFTPMTTTKSGGMGLGLSVTRTIVESHGGNLRVGVSRWGGARFSFNLSTASMDAEE